jgi:hypothetical protein
MSEFYKPDDSFMKAGSNEIWDYKSLPVGSVFCGVYKYMEKNVGTNKSNMYTFMEHEDDKFKSPVKLRSIWGNSLLDIRFRNFEAGELVVLI